MALRTPFLCNFQHFSVSINSFYGNKDYKLAGNFKLLATKLFTSETSVTMDTFRRSQVERIEISVRRGLISLQFHLSLEMMDRETKLIAILRRQYHIILTASWAKIYSVMGGVAKRRSPIRNIFSPNAVNINDIMWYAVSKSQ